MIRRNVEYSFVLFRKGDTDVLHHLHNSHKVFEEMPYTLMIQSGIPSNA